MKKVARFLLFFFTLTLVSQQKNIEIKEDVNTVTKAKVTSLSFNVDNVKELEKIDWTEIKSIFETNAADEIIKLTFGINTNKSANEKVKISGKFSVEGKTKSINTLIKKSKKGIKGLIKIYTNYQN
jgi:hypothetical protein